MAKRTVSVGAVVFVLALVMGGSAAFAFTIGCQGQDVGLSGTALGLGSNSALWTVNGAPGRLVSGYAANMYTNKPGVSGALTCQYTLDSSSTTAIVNGLVEQTLVWDALQSNAKACTNEATPNVSPPYTPPAFTDHVYLNSYGAGAVGMIDDNLDNDDVAGSGTCYLIP